MLPCRTKKNKNESWRMPKTKLKPAAVSTIQPGLSMCRCQLYKEFPYVTRKLALTYTDQEQAQPGIPQHEKIDTWWTPCFVIAFSQNLKFTNQFRRLAGRDPSACTVRRRLAKTNLKPANRPKLEHGHRISKLRYAQNHFNWITWD